MSTSDFTTQAAKLVPAIEARAQETEAMRTVPSATLDELRESGLILGMQPKRYGGKEVHPADFFDAAIALGTVCGSTAWVFAVLGVHSWQLATFPEQAQDEVWGEDPNVLVSSSYMPTGKVEKVDGGYRLSGRWAFSSGCDHAQWVFLGGALPPDDEHPGPQHATFLLPRSDYDIEDTWFVAGLSGSGSKDIVVNDQFVPEHRVLPFRDLLARQTPGQEVNTGPLYRMPYGAIFAYAVAAPAIGVARGVVERFLSTSRARIEAAGPAGIPENAFAQRSLALAQLTVENAEWRMRRLFDDMASHIQADENIPWALRARSRFDAAYATSSCMQSVDSLFQVSGGRAIYQSSQVQRSFRDIHAMSQHIANSVDVASRIYVRTELDIPFYEYLL